jgi:uncharacterized protein (DUF58 family)
MFLFISFSFILLAEIIKRVGFNKLTVKRVINKSSITIGEKVKVTTIIENNKIVPVSFVMLKETIPTLISSCETEDGDIKNYRTSVFGIYSYERQRRSYYIKWNKRGAYSLKGYELSIGDFFGFSSISKNIDDYIEVVVYPKIIDAKDIVFQSTNLQGDNLIKRWIYKDPQYIKGIREYNAEDRMKDIHWKSSLKMNKLMVKEYDYTCDREVTFILNVQCGEPYWYYRNEKVVDNGIDIVCSLANKAVKCGIAVGFLTNAYVINNSKSGNCYIYPSIKSFQSILENCARMDYTPRATLSNVINEYRTKLNKNSTYVFVTPFLDDDSLNIIFKLKKLGYIILVIDISDKGTVPSISGLEKLWYRGNSNEYA